MEEEEERNRAYTNYHITDQKSNSPDLYRQAHNRLMRHVAACRLRCPHKPD